MSELINNREERQKFLKNLILDIHKGKDPKEVKERFQAFLTSVGPTELSQIEQSLIDEGLPVEEVQRLCDVHVSVFRDSITEQIKEQTEIPAHPINTFLAENEAIENLTGEITELFDSFEQQNVDTDIDSFLKSWQRFHTILLSIENHYSRKENLLFPYLEKIGISGPPSVMWSIHDDIRVGLKKISQFLSSPQTDKDNIKAFIENEAKPTLLAIKEMVFKENQILFPMCQETLTEDNWAAIAKESPSIGFTLITPEKVSMPQERSFVPKGEDKAGYLKLDTGVMSLEEINAIFKTLPIDITFVDKDDTVKYFSESKHRIFQRTKAIIGRKVQHCHPPASVHVVTKIVDDLKSGKRDSADFWIRMKDKFVYIRYFAVRDDSGNYLGTMEVSQDINKIRSLEGEKRILDEE